MPRRRPRDDDDDDDDDTPLPRARRKRRGREGSGNSAVWLIGGLALGFVVLVAVVVVVVLATRNKGGPVPQELQGTWRMVSLETPGGRRTGDQRPYDTAEFADGAMTTSAPGRESFRAQIRADATRDPKELDVVDKGFTYPAIYKIEGDTLTICINDIGSPRPREFGTRGLVGSGGVATYKRVPR